MTVTCPTNDTLGVCGTLESAGAGLGVFVQYLTQALPGFLIILAIIGIIVAVGLAIAGVIKKAISSTKVR